MTRDILAPLDCTHHWHCDPSAAAHVCQIDRSKPCPTCGTRGEVTADNLTDKMIHAALDVLPTGHYSRQWYADALGSDHPQRRANARREVAAAINARNKAGTR